MATKADMQAAGSELLNAYDLRAKAADKLASVQQAQHEYDVANAKVATAAVKLKAIIDELSKQPTAPPAAPDPPPEAADPDAS